MRFCIAFLLYDRVGGENMDWLEKAVEGFKASEVQQKSEKEIELLVKESYPQKVQEIWDKFEEVFKLVAEKFGTRSGFNSNKDEMILVLGDVRIRGKAYQVNLLGGYYGKITVNIECIGNFKTGNLPFDSILLTEVEGKPSWIYQIGRSVPSEDKIVTDKTIEKIFQTALSGYINNSI